MTPSPSGGLFGNLTAAIPPGRGCRRGTIIPLFALFGLALSTPGGVEAQYLNIRNYTQAEGLPQAQVYALHQDSLGFLWVGSNSGLARYDGRRFHSITAADGLVSNTVVHIDEFPSGVMVAATSAGVCFLTGPEISCLGQAEGLAVGQIRDLFLDSNGDTWVASDGGISRIRGDDRRIESFGKAEGLPDPATSAILRDRQGTLWAGTRGGMVRFDGEGWEEVSVAGRRGTFVAALHQDVGDLLVGTNRGLFALQGAEFLPIPLGSDPVFVRLLAQEDDGTIWAVSPDGAYRHKEGESLFFTAEQGIPVHAIWSLLVDREGTIWMGNNNGLAKLAQSPFAFYTEDQGLPHPFVRALTQTPDGQVWFGTRDGLAVWEEDGMVEHPIRNLVPDPRVFSLAPDPAGGLLIGTASGLAHRAPGGSIRIFRLNDGLPHALLYSMAPDGEGGVWIGTAQGVVRWTSGRILPPPDPRLEKAAALSMAVDSEGRLWVGLVSGGILVLEGDTVREIGPEEGFSAQAVWSLAPDDDGGVWAGTNGDGAFRISAEEVRRVGVQEGLVDNFVWQVLHDSRGDTWFFTGRGLNRLSGTRMIFYGSAEGLPDLEGSATAALEARSGDLWFGAGTGVYRYQPKLDREVPPPPNLFLETITVGGRQVPKSLREFPPRPGVISFRFSAPTYRDEEGIRFRYRLAGVDQDWSEPSREPLVSFAGLGRGNYLLEVEAETSRGLKTSEVFSLDFTVQAAFFQTLWFNGGLGLALILGLLQLPSLRARHLEAERKRLETLVRARTKEIEDNALRLEQEILERKEAERARESLESQLRQAQKMEAVGRLAGGIAHDFNNLLTSVLGYTELMAENAPPNSELRDDLEEINKSARKGAALVSQLLAFSRQQIVRWQPVDVTEVVRGTTGMAGRILGAQVHLDLDLPNRPLWVRGDPNQLGQVLLNLAVNARDAMPGGGQLLFAAARRTLHESQAAPFSDAVPPGDYVCLLVSDTGEGMDSETLQRAFEPFFTTKEVGKGTGLGLASVHGIVHQHQGFIQLSSAPGEGAQIEIYLPEVEAEPASE